MKTIAEFADRIGATLTVMGKRGALVPYEKSRWTFFLTGSSNVHDDVQNVETM